ncbi:MAG: calcineurin-like phosphoesterase family protein [Chitinophagaceae bacterium]
MKIAGKMYTLLLVQLFLVTSVLAQNRLLSGIVSNQDTRKPIPNVAVTDGFTVARTDAKGVYSFYGHPDAEFVYLSLPSGYKIPAEGFLPKFYQRLKKGQNRYNFELSKEKVDDAHHILIVGADPQPANKEAAQKWSNFAKEYFKPIVEEYGALPKLGILCGDIVGDDLSLFANHKKAVETMGFPTFQVIGNHDENYEARSDEGSQKAFRDNFGPEYYSFNKGKIHYVVLDDVFYMGKDSRYFGYITERQMKWLENDLKFVPQGTTVIVSVHISFEYDTQKPAGSEAVSLPIDSPVENVSHLYSILAPYKVHIMSGHTHWNQSFERNNIFHHIHGAICGAWWGGETSFDGAPLGYAVYEIRNDSISWYFQSAGKDRNHQMQLTYVDSTASVVANVWNWDAKWKVELIADGKEMGEMTRYIGYSPVMSDYYNSLPPGSPWMKPVLTSHLFKMNIGANVKRVSVRVTDRFGRVYNESLNIK